MKKQIQDDDDYDDDTVTTKTAQKYSLASYELECNLIDDKDDKYDNNFVIIPTQVIFRMKHNLNLKSKRNQEWQKDKYSRKVKMRKKIASMISNTTKEYPTSEEDGRKDNEIKGILKMVDQRSLIKKKKKLPNKWPDHPT